MYKVFSCNWKFYSHGIILAGIHSRNIQKTQVFQI